MGVVDVIGIVILAMILGVSSFILGVFAIIAFFYFSFKLGLKKIAKEKEKVVENEPSGV